VYTGVDCPASRVHGVGGSKGKLIMATCLWHKCGKEFTPIQDNQKFCPGGKCKDAHNNWLKMTGIHLCPRALYYIQSIANSRIPPISNDEMANEMISRVANADGEPLRDDEAFGLKVREDGI